MKTISIDGTKIKMPVLTTDPATITRGEIYNVNDDLKLAKGVTPTLQALLDNTHNAATGVHGVGSAYICKTSRSDQAPAWEDIPDKPTTFPPSSHTHVKADITDFAHNHSGETLSPAVLNVGDINFSNGWTLTENDEYGLILVSPKGRRFRLVLREI